ncbi:MAG: SEL1-like repeat protein [Oscillospiraceae bacterium]|nr:SEL1-like repeat protein [Oscillospiraceae bacterium]
MSVDIQTDSSFFGTKRQKFIHYRLFSLLSGYDGHYTRRNGWEDNFTEEEMVFSWFTDINGWDVVEFDAWIFASLARAFPKVDFGYETHMTSEVGSPDENDNDVWYSDGTLHFNSVKRIVTSEEYDEEEGEYNTEYDESSYSYSCKIDGEGRIIGNDILLSECMEEEETMVTDSMAWELSLADLIEIGTDDPQLLMNLGILYETGLAGLEKNPTLAWDYYLNAAGTGDENAVKFVSEIFSAESREELRDLLKNRQISKDVFPVLFDLAQKEDSADLTAELLEYKNALGE